MKNCFKIIIFFFCCRLLAISSVDVMQLEKQLAEPNAVSAIERLDSFSKFQKATPDELISLQQVIPFEERKKFYEKLSKYLQNRIMQNTESSEFKEKLAIIEAYLSLSYLSGIEYLVQERIVKYAFKLFQAPQTTTSMRRELLDILKQKLIMPNPKNYKEYSNNEGRSLLTFFSNRLLFNYFCVLVMEVSLQDNSVKESDTFFKKQIEKLSGELGIKTFDASVVMHENTREFYWLIQEPVGFFFCNQTTIAFKVQNFIETDRGKSKIVN